MGDSCATALFHAPSVPVTVTGGSVPTDWTLGERDMYDLEMLLMGAFAPLTGFMDRADYYRVVNEMRLANGEVFPLPVVLAIPRSAFNISGKDNTVPALSTEHRLALRDNVGTIVAHMDVTDVYEPDVERQIECVLGSSDPNHPYAKYLREHHSQCLYVGGRVQEVHPIQHFDFQECRMKAPDMRRYIREHRWDLVVGFQTRNPMHRSHFELTKYAVQQVMRLNPNRRVNLLITPACGPTQPGDIPYHIRVPCYEKVLKYYDQHLPAQMTGDTGSTSMTETSAVAKLALLPLAMRMAGPREALFHAIIRRNYGCTHFIVGRDHAGPSAKKTDGTSFYGPYEAHELLAKYAKELGIEPVFGTEMVYVGEENGGYFPKDEAPSGVEQRTISGTKFREMLQTRAHVPSWFSFPDVVEELHKFYLPKCQRGMCVYLTGLPCSGKSTVANALKACILANPKECRRVTILDADVIRTHLSRGLGFSKSDRSLNVRRIGYVASEIVNHGGICLVANIAPYEEDRKYNRTLIESTGGSYVEVYISTPIEVCEARDVKELYKKARQGVIKQFTGVSDPYEVPESPDVVVDSSGALQEKINALKTFLKTVDLIA